MKAKIDLRLRRLYHAVGQVRRDLIAAVQAEVIASSSLHTVSLDFNQGRTDADLAHTVGSFIADIACLKDHLKAWCKRSGTAFDPETIVNTNRDVAIIHDLWNKDKHFELTRPSRSGLDPTLSDIRQRARLIAPAGGGYVSITLNPLDGLLSKHGPGTAELVIDAKVRDSAGNNVGHLLDIAERAIGAWETAFVSAGVALPSEA